MPLISIVILNYNGKGFLEDCLGSVLESDYGNFEVILVDNNSSDDSLSSAFERFGQDKRLKVIKNKENLLFTGGNNAGIREARGEYIVILNNDTVVDRNWLKVIAISMQDESIGAAQPGIFIYNTSPLQVDYIGASIDKFGYALGIGREEVYKGQFDNISDVFYAGGTAMILRRKVLGEVGLFDEKFGMHWEDTDLSWRIRLKGYRIVVIPKAIVWHKGSRTMDKFAKKENVAWYIRKNRMSGLIKNYSVISLIKYLPVLIIIYILVFIKELFWDRHLRIALSSLSAIAWNIKELPYILKEREVVQKQIRSVPDKEIVKSMERRPVLFSFLRGNLCL